MILPPAEHPPLSFDAAVLHAAAAAAFPELNAAPVALLTAGWDSVALAIGARFVCKFPRHARAEANLRREARLLALVAPRVSLPVPGLELVEQPRVFSRHAMLPGEHLPPAAYAALSERQREALAQALAQFFAELHAIPLDAAESAGATAVGEWMGSEDLLRLAVPVLTPAERNTASRLADWWSRLTPDPLGNVYGHFDTHGWNMAFDHRLGRLNGIYDFGDSGIGPLHREFVYPGLISGDLVRRIVPAYAALTGRAVEPERVALLNGVHRLWEVACQAHDPGGLALVLSNFRTWLADEAGLAGP